MSLAANVSRGFRAPDVTDLGTFGLTGSGYEVSNREVEGLGATVGSTADAAAVSTGRPVEVLAPETSLSYELTVRYRSRRLQGGPDRVPDRRRRQRRQAVPDPAAGRRRAWPSPASPSRASSPSGVVFVAVSTSPVLVRTNFDEARIRGLEATLDAELSSVRCSWAGRLHLAARRGPRDGLPPNIEGGTPAPEGWLRLRFAPSGGRRFWVEPYLHAAARQERLSTLDLGDRRTGASRSRSSIASFFTNGARARGLVSSGPDGVAGNADDVLLPTGETLAQVQARVLGPTARRRPSSTRSPATSSSASGAPSASPRVTRSSFDLENLGDESYRGISWGLDAPGRGAYLRYSLRF